MAGLLDCSQSASGRQCGLEAVDERCLQIRDGGYFGMGYRESVMFLSLDTCCGHDVDQILTTTDAFSVFAVIRLRGEVRERNLLEASFVSVFSTCSQEIVCVSLYITANP